MYVAHDVRGGGPCCLQTTWELWVYPKMFEYIIYIQKKLLSRNGKKAVPLFSVMADGVGPECNDLPIDGYEFSRNSSVHTVHMHSMYA
jgi:hypothetical protein